MVEVIVLWSRCRVNEYLMVGWVLLRAVVDREARPVVMVGRTARPVVFVPIVVVVLGL